MGDSRLMKYIPFTQSFSSRMCKILCSWLGFSRYIFLNIWLFLKNFQIHSFGLSAVVGVLSNKIFQSFLQRIYFWKEGLLSSVVIFVGLDKFLVFHCFLTPSMGFRKLVCWFL